MATTTTFPYLGDAKLKEEDPDRQLSIKRAPTKADVLKILEAVTPPHYHRPILDDPGGYAALYRQMACQMAIAAERALVSAQSSFFLPYPTQARPPASSARSATFEMALRRTSDMDQGRILEIGSLDMNGDQGRRYTNALRIEWVPYDSETIKIVSMVSEIQGVVGNLDHLADPATGRLDNPETGLPATDILGLAAQGGRSGVGATVTATPAQDSTLADSGRPDQLIANDIGLYVKITASAHAANVGRILKIGSFQSPGVEVPAFSGLRPNSVTLEDLSIRTEVGSVKAADGAVFTDETAAARNQVINDVTLLPVLPVVGDAIYVGALQKFSAITIDISTPGVGDWVVTWEFWNGSAWVSVPNPQDGTGSMQLAGENTVRFDEPVGWATVAVDSTTMFWVRGRLSTLTAHTSSPRAKLLTVFQARPLTPEIGTCEWSVLDWIGLGFEVDSMMAPAGGRDDTLRLLGDSRGVFQQTGESDDQFRVRAARMADVVSPVAINKAVNRELATYGLKGKAIDVANGFDGFFLDEDFLDYYAPGDPADAPLSPYKLPIDHGEAYGGFFVIVPFLDRGDNFGFEWGGTRAQTVLGEQTTAAWGVGYYGGYAITADASYRSIFDAVDKARAGGIGFTMILDRRQNDSICP